MMLSRSLPSLPLACPVLGLLPPSLPLYTRSLARLRFALLSLPIIALNARSNCNNAHLPILYLKRGSRIPTRKFSSVFRTNKHCGGTIKLGHASEVLLQPCRTFLTARRPIWSTIQRGGSMGLQCAAEQRPAYVWWQQCRMWRGRLCAADWCSD